MIFQYKFQTVKSSVEYLYTTNKEVCIFANPNHFFIQDYLKYFVQFLFIFPRTKNTMWIVNWFFTFSAFF